MLTSRWLKNRWRRFFQPSAREHVELASEQKTLGASYTVGPRVITVDKNAAYPKAFINVEEHLYLQTRYV